MDENTYTEKEEEHPVKQTKFQSPLPFVLKLRNLIYGKQKPDVFTQLTFFMNLTIWFVFMLWSVVSYFAILSRQYILRNKGISIEAIIGKRGAELGFAPGEFMDRLITTHAISIICWGVFFVGLIFLYRKRKTFIYMTVIPVLFYLFMQIFYVSFTYFLEDSTTFDKVAILISIVSLILFHFMLKNEPSGGGFNFFGALDEDDEVAEEDA